MPVAHFHITPTSAEQRRRLLVEGSERYAAALDAPIDRVRVFIIEFEPDSVAAAGEPADESGGSVAYFDALVLAGRSAEQRHHLLAELTDLCHDVLGIDKARVRGRVIQVEAQDWGIGGVPASTMRADEIAARAEGAS